MLTQCCRKRVECWRTGHKRPFSLHAVGRREGWRVPGEPTGNPAKGGVATQESIVRPQGCSEKGGCKLGIMRWNMLVYDATSVTLNACRANVFKVFERS